MAADEEIYIAVIVCIHWEKKEYQMCIHQDFSAAIKKAKQIVGNFPVPNIFGNYSLDHSGGHQDMHDEIEWEGWQIEFNIGKL